MIHEIRQSLARTGIRGNLLAFHLEDWYGLAAVESLRAYAIDYTGFPRSDSYKPPIWKIDSGTSLIAEAFQGFERAFRKTIEEFRPDVFVIFSDHGMFEAGMLRICQQLGLPSVFVQEGYISQPMIWFTRHSKLSNAFRSLAQVARKVSDRGKRKQLFRKGSQTNISEVDLPLVRPFGLNGAAIIAAINPSDAQWFVEHGVGRDRVIVTGHVLMDRLWRSVELEERRTIPSSPACFQRGPLHLLVISSGQGHFGRYEEHRWFVEQIRGLTERKGPLQLTVSLRLKPGEHIEDWRSIWSEVDRLVNIPSCSSHLYAQIASADVVVAMNSQVLIESLMIGRPVINLVPIGVQDPFRLCERGVAYSANSCGDLIRIIENRSKLQLSEEQLRQRDVCYEEFFFRFDGRAGERVSEVIRRASSLL
jgi:hypothetical protein